MSERNLKSIMMFGAGIIMLCAATGVLESWRVPILYVFAVCDILGAGLELRKAQA